MQSTSITNYKAWAATIGSVATALVASPVIPVAGNVHVVLSILAMIGTGYATWQVPYLKPSEPIPYDQRPPTGDVK